MICPNCEIEYVEGIKVCVECGTELITNESFELNLINYDDWEIVFTTSDTIEAEMIKANLEGAGIESIILSQQDKSFPSPGDLSIVKILVKKEDLVDAKEIISDINKEE
ncbi:MAG: DUF2007 domain-containing protein [Ignavibacteriae bacterium]|nr:DUF2007 domain-containing protein [Ignavibacteriota bacterium]